MINALFVLIVFLLQLNKDNIHVKWPLGVKTNITYDEATQEVTPTGRHSSRVRLVTIVPNGRAPPPQPQAVPDDRTAPRMSPASTDVNLFFFSSFLFSFLSTVIMKTIETPKKQRSFGEKSTQNYDSNDHTPLQQPTTKKNRRSHQIQNANQTGANRVRPDRVA